jgi:hypothetical protein
MFLLSIDPPGLSDEKKLMLDFDEQDPIIQIQIQSTDQVTASA